MTLKLKTPKLGGNPAVVRRQDSHDELTLSTLATIYGCCGLFDVCSDDALISLSMEGTNQFLDWIGWAPSDVCKLIRNFIDYIAPSGTAASAPTDSVTADPCSTPYTVEFCTCDWILDGFGRYRRAGPVRDITETGLRYCEKQPRYRLDGTLINDDEEYDMLMATEVILQDFKRDIVVGSTLNANGEFDGLERLIKDGYRCSNGQRTQLMDSIVVDWNGNGLAGGAGITWNGAAVGATFNIVDVLIAAYDRIRQRLNWSPSLAQRQLAVGDMVLVMPQSYVDCLLNFYTCWQVCADSVLETLESRTFRNSLNGGMFGAGRIFLHGFEIPILPYDWGLLKGNTRFDMYLLTGQVGNIKLIQGQYDNMNLASAKHPSEYQATDGGRLLTWLDEDETCVKRVTEMRPRLIAWAPWSSARIEDVTCAIVNGPVSPDPTESSFFLQKSFCVASCPD